MQQCKVEQWLPPIFKLKSKEYTVDIENWQFKDFFESLKRLFRSTLRITAAFMCLIRPWFFDIISMYCVKQGAQRVGLSGG